MSTNLHAGGPAGNKAECRWSTTAGESVESEVDWWGSWWCWRSVWRYHHWDVSGTLTYWSDFWLTTHELVT